MGFGVLSSTLLRSRPLCELESGNERVSPVTQSGRTSNVSVTVLVAFASPTGLRSGIIRKLVFTVEDSAFMPSHLLANWSETTPCGPCPLENSER